MRTNAQLHAALQTLPGFDKDELDRAEERADASHPVVQMIRYYGYLLGFGASKYDAHLALAKSLVYGAITQMQTWKKVDFMAACSTRVQ